jgi:hypothetical protein
MPFFQVAKRPPSSSAAIERGITAEAANSEAFIASAAVCQIRVKSSTGDCAQPLKIGN